MMLATPVRSSAWSSTTSTPRRGDAGAGAVRRRVSWAASAGLGIENDGGSQASTTSVPRARRGDDGQRRADALGALAHAGHAEAGPAARRRDAAAVVGHRQAEADAAHARGVHGDAPRPRVPDGVGQRLLGDADDLALDAGAERRAARRWSARPARRWCAAARIDHALPAPRRRPPARRAAAAAPTPSGAPRPCACGRDRRAVSRLRGHRRRQRPPAGALRRLQLHQDRREALRQRVVDVAGDAVALFEHRLTARFERLCSSEAAVVQGQRRLPRHRLEQRRAPATLALRSPRALDSATQPSVRGGSASGATSSESTPCARLNSRTGAGSRASSPSYSIVCGPARARSASRCAAMSSRGSASDAQSGVVGRSSAGRRCWPSTGRSSARRRPAARRRRRGSRFRRPARLMNTRKKPSMSGSRTSRSSASCTASLWIAPCTRRGGGRRSRAAARRAAPAIVGRTSARWP